MAIHDTKKKRVSKKLKVSWRKHVDIGDVEEFLEEKRLEERLGPSLSTVPDKDLFILDTEPTQELLSSKERRKLHASRPLKGFSALEPHTKVPDPIAKRNRVRTKEERKSDLVKKKDEQNRLKGILKAKEKQSIADRRLYEIRKETKPKKGDFTKDLWTEKNTYALENDEWATNNTKKHNLRGVGIPRKNIRKSVQTKTSILPPVEPAHPGMSYNPSFKDHQDLLRIVAEKEAKIIKEDAHLTRVTRGMFSKVTEEKRDKAWIVEMSEGLPSQGSNTEENEVSDDEYKSVNPPVKNKKKTVQQRRKQKEQLALEKARKALKLEKKKVGDIHKLKLLKNEIEKMEKKQNILRDKRIKVKELKKKDTKVLSSTKFEDPDLEFNMGEDITGNLRSFKKEGNLLADRFRSLQKRNILEPSKMYTRKIAKVKKYVRPGHKDDWKKSVARDFL